MCQACYANLLTENPSSDPHHAARVTDNNIVSVL